MRDMRLFRRASDTKTSVIRREAVSTAVDAADVPVAPASRPSSSRPSSRHPVAPVVELGPSSESFVSAAPSSSRSERPFVAAAPPSYERLDDSDVFVCEAHPSRSPESVRSTREVTLFVHGWENVEPGLLSWTFPSLRSALDAVQRMKNAIGWCVVSGAGWDDLDSARADGAVLVEQLS